MIKKTLLLISICLIFHSCGPDKTTPEYAAKQYLTAIKNKDWETATKYSIYSSVDEFKMMESMGGFGITEIRDIKCEVKGKKAMCYFCCSKDSNFNKVLLILNDKNNWVANQSKGSWLDYHYWDSIK